MSGAALASLTSLTFLQISSNQFFGTLPAEGTKGLMRLEAFHIFGNRFVGTLPEAGLRDLSRLIVFIPGSDHQHIHTTNPT
eukprot:2301887-Amphidinium_carterae.3